MSRKSSVSSSNSDRESRKWRTDFKELDSPRSLPTYYGDEELQQHHTPPLSSSLGDDNPLKELQPLRRGTGSAGSVRSAGSAGTREVQSAVFHPLVGGGDGLSDAECEIGVDVSTLPLDIDNPGVHKLLLEDDVPSKESIERSLNCSNPGVIVQRSPEVVPDKSNDDSDTVQEHPESVPTSSSDIFEASSEVSPISSELSLGKIEDTEVETDLMDADDSLDLFQDVRKKGPRPAPPPRPPKPKVAPAELETHPLMQIIDPDPDLSFDDTFNNFKEAKAGPEPPTSGLKGKLSRSFKRRPKSPRPEEGEKSSPTPPVDRTETGSQEGGSTTASDTVSITSSDTTPSRKQKFKAMRSQLAAKAYNKYNQYYDYYYNKNKQIKEEETAERARTSSENSEGSFCEITADEVEVISKVGVVESDSEQSATEFAEDEPQAVTANVTPNNEPATSPSVQSPASPASLQPDIPPPATTTPPSQITPLSRLRNQLNGLSYQKHLIGSSITCLISIVLYVVVYYCNSFLQGLFLGGFVPTLLGVLFLIITRVPPDDDEISEAKTVLQVERLRKLGATSSLKDFFQYTEAHNFGELRTKSMPYRYFKLKGSIIEASELNATKEEVPDPLKLTAAEIKTYGLKPIFKADISGWLVSVEAPPGTKVTPSNMWRKRYPIWLRKRSWRTEVDEYDSEYTVNSFYLISPYSRYKELWYEALRRAVSTTEMEDVCNLEIGTYRDFMERLFDEIPSVEDNDKSSKLGKDANGENTASSEIEAASPVTKAYDMQHSAWVNALFGRFVWNILHDKKWENRIHERIVKKLSSVNTRHISSVELKSFDLGNSVPLITNTYLPKIDHQGVWSEMDLEWSGEVSLTLAARVNSKSSAQGDNSKTFEPMKLETERGSEQAASSGKLAKLYKLIEKIEIGVSAKVTRVAGRLCVNIPPPPTDCIWYGFTEPPELKIHLTPILGRWISLDYRPITNALEKQLQSVFNETFVLPAMENVVMPGMSRNLLTKKESDLPETLDVTQLLEPAPADSELLDVATSPVSRSGSVRNSPAV